MNNFLICDLCPKFCKLKENDTGFCKARKNVNGEIVSLSYGKILSLGLDPIEKKPLANYKKGSLILSTGTFGCNMNCQFCQNHEIARAEEYTYKTYNLSPKELIDIAIEKIPLGNIGVAFTYNEPLIGFEYVFETAKIAKDLGLDIILVTNGQINEKYLLKLLPYVSAWNIDLKTFSGENYKKLGGDLNTTLNTIKLAAESSHVEVTTLIVPGISESIEMMEKEAKFLSEIDDNMILHITRYIPNFHYCEPATDINLLFKLKSIAEKYLKNVLIGNI